MKIKLTLIFVILNSISTLSQCWSKIETGQANCLAIKSDNTLWSWGYNQNGQCGNVTNTNIISPIQIGSASNWKSLTSDYGSSFFIKEDGTLWAFGNNNNGQLGLGNNINVNIPTQVGLESNWLSISSGFEHTMAIKTDGTLWGWGKNDFGQLGGPPYNTSINTPMQIGTENNWQTIESAANRNFALKNDGTLWFWGDNLFPNPAIIIPTQIGSDTNWKVISSSYYHLTALKTDNTLWSMGFNFYGQCGVGTSNDIIVAPIQIGTSNWKSISSAYYHTMGIKSDGTLWIWGRNVLYTYGNGTDTPSFVPLQIGSDIDWEFVAGGETNSYAIKTNGILYSTGDNNVGQIGDGTTTDKLIFTPISCPTLSITNDFINEFDKIKVYPNPSKTIIKIQRSNNINEHFIYEIIDLTGRIVKNGDSKFNEQINIESLETGNYIIQIEIENGKKLTEKLIKN
jgi:alpha-tubulin suppressor-like RCC1 family protein